MPGQTGANQKWKGAEKERVRYVNSDLVPPCNPASFHAAQSDCLLLPVKMAIGILTGLIYRDISLQEINHMLFNSLCMGMSPGSGSGGPRLFSIIT